MRARWIIVRASSRTRDARQLELEFRRYVRPELPRTEQATPTPWDAERVVPRICQSIVSRWGLPVGYEFSDYAQDVAVRLIGNPHDPERSGGRSLTSWVHLLARSVWVNSVAKADRRSRLAPMCSYEQLQELGKI